MWYQIADPVHEQCARLLRTSGPVVLTEYAVLTITDITGAAEPKRAVAPNTWVSVPLNARTIVFSLLALCLALAPVDLLLYIIPPVTALRVNTPAARLDPADERCPGTRALFIHEARESQEVVVPRVLNTVATKRCAAWRASAPSLALRARAAVRARLLPTTAGAARVVRRESWEISFTNPVREVTPPPLPSR